MFGSLCSGRLVTTVIIGNTLFVAPCRRECYHDESPCSDALAVGVDAALAAFRAGRVRTRRKIPMTRGELVLMLQNAATILQFDTSDEQVAAQRAAVMEAFSLCGASAEESPYERAVAGGPADDLDDERRRLEQLRHVSMAKLRVARSRAAQLRRSNVHADTSVFDLQVDALEKVVTDVDEDLDVVRAELDRRTSAVQSD